MTLTLQRCSDVPRVNYIHNASGAMLLSTHLLILPSVGTYASISGQTYVIVGINSMAKPAKIYVQEYVWS